VQLYMAKQLQYRCMQTLELELTRAMIANLQLSQNPLKIACWAFDRDLDRELLCR
jgi:hypothetical protein